MLLLVGLVLPPLAVPAFWAPANVTITKKNSVLAVSGRIANRIEILRPSGFLWAEELLEARIFSDGIPHGIKAEIV